MFLDSLKAGLTAPLRRPGLVFLIYLLNLIPALLLAIPIYRVLAATVGPTGFSGELVRAFDLVLWAEVAEQAFGTLASVLFGLLWILPFYLFWKAALAAGLIYALQGEGARPFWRGLGRYAVRSVGVGLLFLPLLALWAGCAAGIVYGLRTFWPGEVGWFWTFGAAAPLLAAAGLAGLDLMQDYARISLITEERKVRSACRVGLHWPFRHRTAVGLYLAWLGAAALLLVLPTLLEMVLPAASATGIWSLFLLQQLLLLSRAAVTVAWFGSEVSLFQKIRRREGRPEVPASSGLLPPLFRHPSRCSAP